MKIAVCLFLITLLGIAFGYTLPPIGKRNLQRIIKANWEIGKSYYIKNKAESIFVLFYIVFIGSSILLIDNIKTDFNPFRIYDISLVKEALNFYTVSYGAIIAILSSLMYFYYSHVQQKYTRYTKVYLSEISFTKPYFYVVLNLIVSFYFNAKINIRGVEIQKYYYFSMIIFIITLFYLLYLTKKCAVISYGKKCYLQVISQINQFDIEFFKRGYSRNDSWQLVRLETNNIYIIGEMALNYIDNNNNIDARIIVAELEEKIESLIKNDIGKQGITERDIFDSLSYTYMKIANYAIDKNSISVVHYIVSNSLKAHTFCSESDVSWSEYFEFDDFLKNLARKVIKIDDKDLSISYIYSALKMQSTYLENNCPKEDEIIAYYWSTDNKLPEHDKLKESHWDYISRNLTSMLLEIGDEIINIANETLYTSFLYAASSHMREISSLGISDLQKNILINDWIFGLRSQIAKSIQKRIYYSDFFLFSIGNICVEEILGKRNNTSINLIIVMLQINDIAIENGYISLYLIDELFTKIRMLLVNTDVDDFLEKFVIFFLEYIRKVIKEIETNKKDKLYLELFETIKQHEKLLSDKVSIKVKTEFELVIKLMNKYDSLKEKMTKYSINWPDKI